MKEWIKAFESPWVKGATWAAFVMVMISIGIDIWYAIFR